jgi:hypothetical protein
MLTPLTVRGPLVVSPDDVRLPSPVTFTIMLEDESAPQSGTNSRTLTLTLQPGNDVTFENGSKTISDTKGIGRIPQLVSMSHQLRGTGRDLTGTILLQVSVVLTDDTLKTLGSVLVGLL